MNQEDLENAIRFLEDLRCIKKKYDLDYHHLVDKYYSRPGSPFVRYNPNLGYLFDGLSRTREQEGVVIDKWYEDYTKRLLKTYSTESITD